MLIRPWSCNHTRIWDDHAWDDSALGVPRCHRDKQDRECPIGQEKEGREALKGAIITFLGAWFFPLFAVVIDKAGVSTLSCVNFANIM
ncbi:hypothetical protein ACFFQF_16555 [Haladaptatus pallidirubidus]|uniref:hypothetical protein n=1 Tax=Haladaptatus pallidirubidus TaxID=1008152 RepID=UPI0035EDFD69